jgi:integrase
MNQTGKAADADGVELGPECRTITRGTDVLLSIVVARHAFRRGLGTRLNEACVESEEIQSILRHADVSTTMAFYVLPDQKRAQKGLKKLEEVARNKYHIKA